MPPLTPLSKGMKIIRYITQESNLQSRYHSPGRGIQDRGITDNIVQVGKGPI